MNKILKTLIDKKGIALNLEKYSYKKSTNNKLYRLCESLKHFDYNLEHDLTEIIHTIQKNKIKVLYLTLRNNGIYTYLYVSTIPPAPTYFPLEEFLEIRIKDIKQFKLARLLSNENRT